MIPGAAQVVDTAWLIRELADRDDLADRLLGSIQTHRRSDGRVGLSRWPPREFFPFARGGLFPSEDR